MTAHVKKAYVTAGMNTGRTEVDYCGVVTANPQVVPVVATTATAGVATFTQPRNPTFCDTVTPWRAQTQVKAAAVYTFPFDIQTSASFQHFPGATQSANIVANNALIGPSLLRTLYCGSERDRRCRRLAVAASVRRQLEPNRYSFHQGIQAERQS